MGGTARAGLETGALAVGGVCRGTEPAMLLGGGAGVPWVLGVTGATVGVLRFFCTGPGTPVLEADTAADPVERFP